jgi:hypothetical protein
MAFLKQIGHDFDALQNGVDNLHESEGTRVVGNLLVDTNI